MKGLFFRTIILASGFASLYTISERSARADEWGCQVILCLSNPGGPTQYGECRPPVEKLWKWLAKGRSFPTCTGVGFQTSRPFYEPYHCSAGYRLSAGYGPKGRDATCISTSLRPVSEAFCRSDSVGGDPNKGLVTSPRWQKVEGRYQCLAHIVARPLLRDKPRYVDLTIEGVGKQRVWF
ncbi:hypothetical protein N5C66_29270 [Rhizobium pusense]|uniref:hypothetical protein n=1 Tax=Agrobacterium TaxID=357 RepID=UPI0009316549|nr:MULTISPECIES: hypothetical protein [Agrobacterium]MDH0912956.1 hypothetical protein [Agrobacterium pusense]MDH1099214.1 hypothetical protein [Agrobacterium pusense]MDH1115775.1 hypothetical protein [Agrobacterium pusense]MDH2197514.1 hypothetical protein [Agrobacterium pusense]